MKQQLEQRLKELRTEFETGQKTLADLDIKQANLRNTLIRISGAIQVLEEELGRFNADIGQPFQQSYLKPEEQVESEEVETGDEQDIASLE